MISLHAHDSPFLAASTTFLTTSAVSAANSFSAMMVARWRAPLGLPAGLPRLPRTKVPSGFRPVFDGSSLTTAL